MKMPIEVISDLTFSKGQHMKVLNCLFYVLIAIIIAVSFYADFRNPFSNREVPGFDGRLRLNEVEVLRMGINPFDVLSGRIYPPEGYIAGNHAVNERWEVPPKGNKEVHTYTPWSYTLMLPFTYMPRVRAGRIFWCLDTLALLFVVGFAFFVGRKIRGKWLDGVFVAAAAVCLGNPFPVNSDLNNYSTLLIVATIGLCWCLNRGYDVAAAFCWAALMIKPHFGILFAFPVLMQRKWKTCVIAPLICIALSIPPALMCHRSPMDMILNVVDKDGAGFCFQWTGFFPAPVFAKLEPLLTGQGVCLLSMVIGVAVLIAMLWQLRREKDFFVLILPVALTIPMWLYSQFQDATILCFVQMALATAIIKSKNLKQSVVLGFILLMNAARFFISLRGYDILKPYSPYLTGICHLVKFIGYCASVWFVCRIVEKENRS